MKRVWPLLVLTTIVLFCAGWIDYDDKVEKAEPTFGKEFLGFSLKVCTANAEFEQESPEPVTVTLKNDTARGTLLPPGVKSDNRTYALYMVLADEHGTSRFSPNLLEGKEAVVANGKIPTKSEVEVLKIGFDAIKVATVEEFEFGLPCFDPKMPPHSAGQLVPQIYTLKAILVSGLPDQRPDFVAASEIWRILLRPKSAARMTAAEKRTKMSKYLSKMGEGAYGGIGVSSQLAALGEMAVDPLIAMAEKKAADGAVRESRIWAIVTLCNTRSPKAEEYILKKIHNPVGYGDLAFLVWHSQGFRSQKITETLRDLALKIVTDQELPWEKKHGRESRVHGIGCLKFILKHFISIRQTVPDEVALGSTRLEDPELVCLAIQVWKPSSPAKAVETLKPFFATAGLHPNLKRIAMRRLSMELGAQGLPPFDRAADLDASWQQTAMWLAKNGHFSDAEATQFLRTQVLCVKAPDLQREVILKLRTYVRSGFPVRTPQIKLPDHWIETWTWSLKTGGFSREQAVRFLCNQMRTNEELDPKIKRALLIELKKQIGAGFPLKSTTNVNLDNDWPTCGNWLIHKGYFGKPKKR